MDVLPNNAKYYFESKQIFRHELDSIRAFIEEDYAVGMHMQDFFEINIITRGRGKHYIEENVLSAKDGDVFIVPPHVKHGYTGGPGFDVFHILISDRFIKKHMVDLQMLPSFFILFSAEPLMRAKAKKPLHLRLSEDQFQGVRAVLDEMLLYRRAKDVSDYLIRNSLTIVLISLLCKLYTETAKSTESAVSKNDEAFMRAISMIHERYYEKLTITELAETALLSRSAFIRKFREVCNMPPSEYITRRRLEAAEYMLTHTEFSIFEISLKTGFYDASHFNKIFTAQEGCSPSDYRNGVRVKEPSRKI